MGTLRGELRYALRQFWLARVFTGAAVLTLALGLGGTTAIFTLVHAVMLRSLPVVDPRIAKDLTKLLEDRGPHRAGAHRVLTRNPRSLKSGSCAARMVHKSRSSFDSG